MFVQNHSEEQGQTPRVLPDFPYHTIEVILCHPSVYDDDGYVQRYRFGALPANPCAVMNALTTEALDRILPPDIRQRTTIKVRVLEDNLYAHAKELARIHRYYAGIGIWNRTRNLFRRLFGLPDPREHTKLIVGFVAVQSAQFPRACDLIDRWLPVGATCVIGGFHVSGTIATMLDGIADKQRPDIPCPHVMPADIQMLMDKDVIVYHGEAESMWPTALADILNGTPQPLYRGGTPDIEFAPLPRYPEGYHDHFATAIRTFDTARGCPQKCSFCCIISVQGRSMRYRNPATVVREIRRICNQNALAAVRKKYRFTMLMRRFVPKALRPWMPKRTHSFITVFRSFRKASFFFTDDNFGRNPVWEQILDGLGVLRTRGFDIGFMIQTDLATYRLPRFIEKLAAAGCISIFQGVESLNPQNLAVAGKPQNQPENYKKFWDLCDQFGISTQATYIFGLPFDTEESLISDIRKLISFGVTQFWPFILMPLPGSEDHVRKTVAGIPIEEDLNRYDGMHVVQDHPLMTRDQLLRAFHRCIREFYSTANIITALKSRKTRFLLLNQLRNFGWIRWSFFAERTHPMNCGFWRIRTYRDRRPGSESISSLTHMWREAKRKLRLLILFLHEFYVFQKVMFEIDKAPAFTNRRDAIVERISGIRDWLRITFGRLTTRRPIDAFWRWYGSRKWRLLNPFHPGHMAIPFMSFTEIVLFIRTAIRMPRIIRKIIK